MSRCMSISLDNGEYARLPKGAPPTYREYDYGSYISAVWKDLARIAVSLSLSPLDEFLCPERAYYELDEVEEELEEAEDEGDEERVQELRKKAASLRPAHAPEAVLATVRGLVRFLDEKPQELDPSHRPGHSLAETALVELGAYELALEKARGEGRKVFINPY